jgi:acetyl-CoA carboxylase biotin carboxylase subunit
MGQAAVNAAKACNYQNAGTIEFLVDKNRNFYFLEMNTRLQVEHPVTELVTGLDLVKEQLHIAAGEPLRVKKSVTTFWGHAFECRLYAEDAENNWTPSPGVIEYLNASKGPGIREDSGVTKGSEISLYYDPMISKLCVWAADRQHALNRMLRALREYEISGIKTSIPFLIRVFEQKDFRAGNFTTKFIEEYKDELYGEDKELAEIAALAAILGQIEEQKKVSVINKNANGQTASGWKMSHRKQQLRF